VTNRGDSRNPSAEAEAAIREYEISRDRYLQTIIADAEARVSKSFARRRDKLSEEIENLRGLGRIRADARSAAVKAYQQRCPTRVSAASLLPPTPADRVANPGVDKLFKAAVKAAEEFNEINEMMRKRREMLEAIDQETRDHVRKYQEEVITLLETPDGLANAFKRDPLLGQAHARMKALLAQRDAAQAGGTA
jgi:malate synthase